MNPNPSGPPDPSPQQASPESLPAMNETAAQSTAGTSNGATVCKKKTWFAVSIYKVDEKNVEVPAPDITIDLNITDLGNVQRVTATSPKVILIRDLEQGGKGDVLQMTHSTDVYEVVEDFT